MRKPFIIALVALLILGIGGYFGIGLYVNHVARSEVDSALGTLRADGATASVEDVRYDLFAGRFEMRGLSLAGPGQGALKIGTLVASGVEQRGNERVFARDVALTDVALSPPLGLGGIDTSEYRAPRAEITGLEFPMRAPVDGTPPQIALSFLRQVTAERVDIPVSTNTGSSGTGDTRIVSEETNGAIRLDALAKGRFARVTAEPSRFTLSGPTGSSGKGSVGRVEITGFDVAAVLILLDSELREASDAFITVHDSIAMADYELTLDGGVSQRIKNMTMKEVAIRPSAIPVEQILAMRGVLAALLLLA
ncbi:MAG: hypothetical protein E2577_05590, partial [Starkeya sp.]|nr:hypothetical protein [Starkeya sp.]